MKRSQAIGRRPTLGTLARLLAEPQRFGFDAGVAILMRAAGTPDPAEAAQFHAQPGLSFPPADIAAVVAADGGRRPQVTTSVMGLTGPSGVLPRFYSEVLARTVRDGSRAMRDLTDLLSHRFVAHFARAGTKYRLHRAAATAELARPPANDGVADALLALTGYGTPHLSDRLAAGPMPLLHYAGLLAMRPRSAERLAALLSDWLGRRVEVVQFAGAWLALRPDQRSRLPAGGGPGAWNRLGMGAAIGVRAWDVQARVVLRVGPLDRAAFAALLPDRPTLRHLVSLARAYLGFETGFAINPILAAEQVPGLRLDTEGLGPRLGWTTWLAADGLDRAGDAADAVFEAETVEACATTAGSGI